MAAALHEIGLLYAQIGRDDRARECYEASLELWREVGDERGEAHTLAALGYLAQTADLTEARHLWRQSLSIARRLQMPIASELNRLLQTERTPE
jgi:tetratricopeptide (TPR) repeat protein